MKFAYTAYQERAYVAHAPTVLTKSALAEGGKLILEILSHIRRLYPKLYGPVVSLIRAPERR